MLFLTTVNRSRVVMHVQTTVLLCTWRLIQFILIVESQSYRQIRIWDFKCFENTLWYGTFAVSATQQLHCQ